MNQIADLWAGESVELLKELHILTRDGQLNQDSRRKLKQVQHLLQFITPVLDELNSLPEVPFTLADLGAGKSYLGFLLYDIWLRNHENTRLFAIESRSSLVQTSKKIAAQSGFDRIQFNEETILSSMSNASSSTDSSNPTSMLPETIDAVTALHACDTATDEAIAFALKKNAKFLALVPCCQAEVARLLEKGGTHSAAKNLWSHPIHRREFGSHLTNVIRALFLESQGYKVRVTELVGWEHSVKNELILATRIQRSNPRAKAQLESLLEGIFETHEVPMRLFDLVKS